ncbi:MAG: SRPBCC domain-containing protein [Planctomycetaceae bacterium]|nr:SRPBCC domain-containing protein [Planctomycetaceae bacterium]
MSAPPPEHSLAIIRTVNASAADIYAAWIDLPRMARWLGKVTADVRVGGRYHFESPAEGGKTYVYTGEYLAIEDGRRVKQSFLAGEPDPNTPNPYTDEFIEIRLKPLDAHRTEFTFTNGWSGESMNDEFRDAVIAAWSEWLDRMERSLSATP